jgi:transcriptional regulator with XRE-family HTH domain
MTPKRFKDIRIQAGLSLEGLSEVIRLSSRTIRRYEKGTYDIAPPVQVLMELIEQKRP